MTHPPALRIGLIGCGNIAPAYLLNAPGFPGFTFLACADRDAAAACALAERFGLVAETPEALLARPDIDLILNLTPPAAHAEVLRAALLAGKHVHSEKPLTVSSADGKALLELAESRSLRIGAAPDTFLGAGARLARHLLDQGAIGVPLSGTAAFLSHGMEHWHPAPQAFYRPGAGPLFDMGPYYLSVLVGLLGPVLRVNATGRQGFARRILTAPDAPDHGREFPVEVLTHLQALLEFSGGVQVVLTTSWDVWKHGQAPIEIHGTEGSLRLPDPNTFGGAVLIAEGRGDWAVRDSSGQAFGRENWPPEAPRLANYRGLGLAEMAAAIHEGRPHRADGRLALHLVAVMEAALASAAAQGAPQEITLLCGRPAPLGEAEARALGLPA